ncbi:MAG: IS3 family transposase [Clostridia bacterium]|nr:IS3 family transposase [Clostridia bacterium]
MNSIQTALNREQRHIVVEMAAGTGKGIVFAKIVEFLQQTKNYKYESVNAFIQKLHEYIYYYNNQRISLKLKMSPVQYRTQFQYN